MQYETLKLSYKDDIAILELNRPELMNSLCLKMAQEVNKILKDLSKKKEVKALVVTGSGKSFCAGAELNEDLMITNVGEKLNKDMLEYFNPWIENIQNLSIPVITALNGVAAGAGVGIALASDLIIASKSSSFLLSFTPKLGLVPDMGASWHLPRIIGVARAKAVTLLGDPISADQALEWGMIWRVVEPEDLIETALIYAKKLSKIPSHAAYTTRKLYRYSLDNELIEQLDYERYKQSILIEYPSFKEGVKAFQQRRNPVFD